jgi:hypothetical protein
MGYTYKMKETVLLVIEISFPKTIKSFVHRSNYSYSNHPCKNLLTEQGDLDQDVADSAGAAARSGNHAGPKPAGREVRIVRIFKTKERVLKC